MVIEAPLAQAAVATTGRVWTLAVLVVALFHTIVPLQSAGAVAVLAVTAPVISRKGGALPVAGGWKVGAVAVPVLVSTVPAAPSAEGHDTVCDGWVAA